MPTITKTKDKTQRTTKPPQRTTERTQRTTVTSAATRWKKTYYEFLFTMLFALKVLQIC